MVTVTPEREKARRLLGADAHQRERGRSSPDRERHRSPPVDDLAGQAVFVRKGSIYDESLAR
jgi:hypothetical protein